MADVFSLMGTIAVNYSDAVSGLNKVDSAADDAASGLESADSAADSTGGALDSLGSDAESAGDDLDGLGDDADSAGSDIDDMGSDADDASSDVDDLGSSADSTAGDIDGLADSADSASDGLSGLSEGVGDVAGGFMNASGMGGEFSGILSAFAAGNIVGGVTELFGALVKQIGDLATGFEDTKDIISKGTGETGDDLTEMANTAVSAYGKIAKASKTSCDDVAGTLAEVSTRLNLTGDDLEDMTVLMQNFADVTDQDGVDAVDDITNVMHYWGMETEDIPGLLDDVTTASQGCQASADDLQDALKEGAGGFQSIGYSVEDALAFLWQYSDTGGDVSEVTNALRFAVANLTDVTDDVPGAWQEVINIMENTDTTAEALSTQVGDTGLTVEDVFGKKVAQKMVKNIQAGNTSLDDFKTALEDDDGALDSTVESVTTASDKFAQFGGRLKSDISSVVSPALQTLGSGFADALNTVLDFCEHPLKSLSTLGSNISSVFGNIKDTIGGAMDTAAEKVKGGWDNITTAYEEGGGGITGIASAAMTGITGLWETGMDALNTVTGGRLTDVTNAFKTGLDTATTTVTNFMGKVGDFFKTGMNTVGTTVSNALTNVKNFFSNHLGSAKNTTDSDMKSIDSTVNSKMSSVSKTTSSNLSTVKSSFDTNLSTSEKTTSTDLGKVDSDFSTNLKSASKTTSDKMSDIKDSFQTQMETAKEKVGSAIETIKGKFNFSWSLPSLKLPHISVSGSFSLNPPSVPSFGIQWYKDAMDAGMIMNDPTIFGFDASTGNFLAGGEAGSETVVGTKSLMDMITAASGSEEVTDRLDILIGLLQAYFPEALKAADKDVVLDSGELVGAMTPEINKQLGRLGVRKARGVA